MFWICQKRWVGNDDFDIFYGLVNGSQNVVEVLVDIHFNERDGVFVDSLDFYHFINRNRHFFVRVFWNFHTIDVNHKNDVHHHTEGCVDINVLHTHSRHIDHVVYRCNCLNLCGILIRYNRIVHFYVKVNCLDVHFRYVHGNDELVVFTYHESRLNTLPIYSYLYTFNLVYDYVVLYDLFAILNHVFHNQIHPVLCTRNVYCPKRFNLSTRNEV